MLPIKEEFNNITNKELVMIVSKKEKLNVNYYPILAKRINEENLFEKFLLDEISSENNMNEIFFGFVKIAWLPLLSILEFTQSPYIEKAVNLFKEWPKSERQNFLKYIEHEENLIKYFE